MAELDINPIERFAVPGAVIKRPFEVAHFSYDDEHNFHLDDSSLKYYYTPTLNVSLSAGFETFRKIDDSVDEHLDSLLKTIIAWEKREERRMEADIITWRGMMTKVMTAPYGNHDSFEMNATQFQGTIFIEENHDHKIRSLRQQSNRRTKPGMPSQDLMSYWGYKFEALSLLPHPWDKTPREFIEDRPNHVVSNYAQYCSVVQTGIGSTKLILAGEVDAVWDQRPVDTTQKINWVELKTSAEFRSDADTLKFERKLNKFWAQSFLLGVPKIVVGFRTNDVEGRLLRIQDFETTKIPAKVRNTGKGTWESNVCINFAAAFLEVMKQTIQGEGVWRICKQDRSSKIEIFRIREFGHENILNKEFLDWRSERI